MSKWITAFASLFMVLSTSRLFGIEVCFVNDSNRTAIVTVITGAERVEQKLKPHSHVFVSLADSKNDRVVIAQSVTESDAPAKSSSVKVVDAKIIASNTNRLNFCYVNGTEAEGLRLDLMAYVCLDIVPQQWGAEPSNSQFQSLRAKLIKSLATTEELASGSDTSLKKFVRQFSLAQ